MKKIKSIWMRIFRPAEYRSRYARWHRIQDHIDLMQKRYPDDSTGKQMMESKRMVIGELMKRQEGIWG